MDGEGVSASPLARTLYQPATYHSGMWLRIGTIATVIVASGLLVATWVRSDDNLPADLVTCLDEAKKANAAHDIELERRLLEHAGKLPGEAKDTAAERPRRRQGTQGSPRLPCA